LSPHANSQCSPGIEATKEGTKKVSSKVKKEIKINYEVLKKINNQNFCFLTYFNRAYPGFEGDIIKFLSLKKIDPMNRIIIATKLLPNSLLKVFAIDCAIKAQISAASSSDPRLNKRAEMAAKMASHCIALSESCWVSFASRRAAEAAAEASTNKFIHPYPDPKGAYYKSLEDSVKALIYLIQREST